MEALRIALESYAAANPMKMGGGVTAHSDINKNMSREDLQNTLAKINQRNEKYFVVGVGMAIVLFIVLVIIALLHQRDSIAAQAVPPVLGTSAAVVVWRMFHTWREKSYTDCVLALLPNVDEKTFRTIVAVLIKKI